MNLRDLPIKRKLMAVILVTSGVILLLATTAFMVADWVVFRRVMGEIYSTRALVIGETASSSLAFQDAADAERVLSSMRADPRTDAAALYDKDGRLFARFPTNAPPDSLPARMEPDGHRFDSHLHVFQPLKVGANRVGTLYLRANLSALRERLVLYAWIALGVVVLSGLVAVGLSSVLQARISDPVLALAAVARGVTEREDYSARAPEFGRDELGQLTRAFNTMLARVQERDASLQRSEVRFRSLVTATSQIVWNTDAHGQVSGPLPAWQAFTGQKDAEIQGAGWAKALHPDDIVHTLEVWRKAVETRTLYDVEYRIRRQDGAYRYFVARGVPVQNEDGSIREWVGTCTDIHERKLAEEAIKEREQAFRQLADSMPQIVWAARPDGFLDYYNQRWFEFTGMSFEQTQGWGWQPVLHPDDLQPCIERWTESFTTGKPYHIEYRFKRASDGTYRWHLGRALPVRDAAGSILRWYGTCTDIHDFKHVQEALRESDERLNTALAASGVGTWSWNVVQNSIIWDDFIHPLFGLKPKTFPGRYEDFLSLVHPDDRERITQEVSASVERSTPYDTEYRVIWPDGTVHWVASRGQVYRDPAGRPLRMTGVCWDITARKASDADLARLRNQLELILSSVGDGIHGLDRHGNIIFENPAAIRMLGWELDELLGKPAHVTMHHTRPDGSAYPTHECHIYSTLKDGQVRRVDDEVFWRKDGRSFPVEYVSTAIRDSSGEVNGTVVIFRDITERKQAEQRLKQFTEELKRSNQELEHFAYVASHDLQEPLRTVASFSQLLGTRYKGKLDADADDFIQFIVDGANRMQTLINDLLSFSRVGTRGKPFSNVSLENILKGVLEDLDTAIEQRRAVVTHDPLPEVLSDDVQMRQLLQNLIGNAIKFHQPDAPPKVHVSATRNGAGWQFSVRDNGIGIDPEYFDRVFIIFQRLHGREEYPGTGIGLAVCKKIVERHDGRIWVESEPGVGSTFFFTLPDRRETL